jgi:MFS family permease
MQRTAAVGANQHNPVGSKGLRAVIRALDHRNFRLFFGGQSISLIGTWMQRIALGWLVYRLTNSAFLLGAVGFAGQIPIFFIAPFAGVFADRWNRQRMLILTQTLSMAQALLLSFLVLTGTVSVWQIIALSAFLGVVNAFDMPIRQAFTLEMIENKEDLGNAIALNSSMVNSARLLGPSLAGMLIAVFGEGTCFLLNGISYVAVIAALLAMKINPRPPQPRRPPAMQELKQGFAYAFGFAPIRDVLLLLGLVSLVGMPYTVLMPIFARDILHGGPHVLGFLMGASGIGALAGAVYLASRKSVLGLGKIIPLAEAALMMQPGKGGVFVGSGIFKSAEPDRRALNSGAPDVPGKLQPPPKQPGQEPPSGRCNPWQHPSFRRSAWPAPARFPLR